MAKKQQYLIYLLLIFTLLAPLLTIIDRFNFLFFRDYLYISVSISGFILILSIVNSVKHVKSKYNLLDILVLLYFLYNAINLLTLNNIAFKSEIIFLSLQLLLYFTLKQFFTSGIENLHSARHHFIAFVLAINFIPLIIGVLEYTGIVPIFGIGFVMTGGFLNQGVFANFIATLLPFSFSVILFSGNNSRAVKILAYFAFLASFATLIITVARSAWIAGLVSTIYVLFHHQKITETIKKLVYTRIKRLVFIGVITVAVVTSSAALYSFKKDSANGRLFTWKICLDIIKENPLFGNGYNSFRVAYNEHQIAYFRQNPNDIKNGMLANEAKFAFNDYLETMTETGSIGILLFLSIIIYALVVKKQEDETSTKSDYVLIGVKSGILATMICSMFSYPLRNPVHYTLLIILISYISANYSPPKHYRILKKKLQLIISSVTFILVSYILYNQISLFLNSYRWKAAFDQAQTIEITESLDTYKTLYPYLDNHFLFLFNYGSTLYKAGQFEEGLKILESAKKYYTTFDLYLNMGESYERINQFDKAEEYYTDASCLIPHKLTPKYYLFKLYLKSNQTEKASKMASLINNMEIKIYTPLAGEIKNEVLEYLRKIKK